MTNVTKLIQPAAENPAADMFGLEGSAVDFPVATRPIAAVGKMGATLPIDTHKAVIRSDGTDVYPISVVGEGYNLLKYRDYFTEIEKTLVSNIEPGLLRGAYVRTALGNNGAFARREYVLPAFAEELRTSNDFKTDLGFRVIAWNSYDMSSSMGMASGLIDFFCTNGCIMGSMVDQGKRRHTKNLTADFFSPLLIMGIKKVAKEIEMLRKLAMTQLDRDAAVTLLEDSFSARRAEKMIARMDEEVAVRGNNVFALHSALTFYSSHNSEDFKVRETGNDNVAATLHAREAEVSKLMPKVFALAA